MKSIRLFILLLIFSVLVACDKQVPANKYIMVTSLSSDGEYAITTSLAKQAILWNIKNKTYKIIATNANIYSAYFIKHSNDFIYQNDKTNIVYVKNIEGKTIKIIKPGFPTYGEVLTSDLQSYYAVDVKDQIYSIKKTK